MLHGAVIGAALAVFLGWGVYAVHRRFRYRDEFSLRTEAVSLIAVLLFFVFGLEEVRNYLTGNILLQISASLGLLVSVLALYGHIMISFASRLAVELGSYNEPFTPDRPRFTPAEILERQEDYEGALKEYLVLARLFPKNGEVLARVAECYLKLDRPKDAAPLFQRALGCFEGDNDRMTILRRLCEVHERHLNNRDAARRLLQKHMELFPESPNCVTIVRRLKHLEEAPVVHDIPEGLAALEENPLEEGPDEPATRPLREAIGLEAPGTPLGIFMSPEQDVPADSPWKAVLDVVRLETPLPPAKDSTQEIPIINLRVEPLEERPFEDDGESPERSKRRKSRIRLDALEEKPFEEEDEPETPRHPGGPSSAGLDEM